MSTLSSILGLLLSLATFGGLIGWILWRWGRSSSDPPSILGIKIAVTLVLGGAGVWCMVNVGPFIGVPVAAVCGILVGLCWAKNIGLVLASPLSSLYDGGNEAPEAKPFYAIAEAHRKQARYADALEEIGKQLERFPGDVPGLLMEAEIRCRHLQDWQGARLAIEQIVGNEQQPVPTRAKALQALADWHLDLAQDAVGARELLERIRELWPDTPEALDAAQRLAHTGDGAWRREQKAPTRLHLPKADERLGLRRPEELPPPPPEQDPELEAEELRQHLAAHPLDTEARERLGLLYANRMGRLDWALGEFEKMLHQPNHPPKLVARWFHQLADIQIRCGGTEDGARMALQRVVDLFPDSALAAKARSRIEHLKLEMRRNEKGQIVRPGSTSHTGPDS